MPEAYQEFKLSLTWEEVTRQTYQVSVNYHPSDNEMIPGGPTTYSLGSAFGAINELSNLMSSDVNRSEKMAQLIEGGRQVANLLLPKGEIRDEFRTVWKDHAIRLRLIYPDDLVQLPRLLEIPWEHIYLPKDEDDDGAEGDPEYLLGLREDISIVHSLAQLAPSSEPHFIEQLKVKMEYLSWLGPGANHADDKDLFQDFIEELARLEAVVNCRNIHDLKPFHINIEKDPPSMPRSVQAEREDVMLALQNDDLVHLVSHGDPGAIWLKDDQLHELELSLNLFEFIQEQLAAKVVILLSCNSGDGAGSIAAALHRAGVAMVIGTTRRIPVPAARSFVDGFYKAIAARPSAGLEKATIQGRRSMFKQDRVTKWWYAGFGLPRLFLNSPDSFLIREQALFDPGQMIKHIDNYRGSLISDAAIQGANAEAIQQMKNWVQQNEGAPARRWYLVAGESGSGKSTQIALLLNELESEASSLKLTYHFCLDRPLETGDPNKVFETSDPLAFVRDSLVPQLAKHFGQEKYYGWCPPGQFPLLTGNADDALINFVYLPLREAQKENEKVLPVIIIDGIDLIPFRDERQNSILGLLLRHRDKLDDVARFLITADSIDETAPEEATLIMEDIYNLTFHQNEPPDLIIRQPDNALILFDQMVKEQFKSLDIPQMLEDKSGRGLYKLFEAAREAAQGKYNLTEEQKVMVNRLLDVTALAYEPLHIYDVAAIIGLQANSDEMKELLQAVQPFFKNIDVYQHKLILYHNRLKSYLLHDIGLWERRSAALIHELFVAAFRPSGGDWSKIADWSTLAGTKWQNLSFSSSAASMSSYVKRYLSYHAYQSYYHTLWRYPDARQRRAEDFLNLICDPGFRTVRLIEAGQKASVQDLWNGLRIIYTEYIHNLPPQANNDKARLALDRLLAANEPGSFRRKQLIELERKLRDGKAAAPDLSEFLGLDPNLVKA